MIKPDDLDINNLIDKVAELFDYINQSLDTHEKMLKDLLSESHYKDIYQLNLMLSEIHVIDCIGSHKLPNATFISNKMNMTRGAISKIMNKLLDKDLVKGNQLENNKKEIYYALTAKGKEIFKIHEKLHKAEQDKFMLLFRKYNKDELSTVNRFLDDLLQEVKSGGV